MTIMTAQYELSKSRVEWLMQKHGITTYVDLADRLGEDLRALMRWVNHESQIKAADAVRLASILATSVDYLMGMTENAAPAPGVQLVDVDLSDEERELILALRRRQSDKAVQAFATLHNRSK